MTFRQRNTGCCAQPCGSRYNPSYERLEYDYSKEDKGGRQDLPRIRQRGEYYIDTFNSESWSCSFGTQEEVRLHCCESFIF
jgi:hypothetical protein